VHSLSRCQSVLPACIFQVMEHVLTGRSPTTGPSSAASVASRRCQPQCLRKGLTMVAFSGESQYPIDYSRGAELKVSPRRCPNNPKARCGFFQWDDDGGGGAERSSRGGYGGAGSSGPSAGGGAGANDGESRVPSRGWRMDLTLQNATNAIRPVIGRARAPMKVVVGLQRRGPRRRARLLVEGQEQRTVSTLRPQY
jgi:hypothetical protein